MARKHAAKPCPACDRDVERGTREMGVAAGCPSCHRTLVVAKVGRTWGWELASEQLPVEQGDESEEFTEATIEAETDEDGDRKLIGVTLSDDEVEVDWWGRGTVRFRPDDLRAALANQVLIEQMGDVWIHDRDSGQQGYEARILDGNFTASARDGCSPATVPWEPFRTALEQALATIETRKGEVMT